MHAYIHTLRTYIHYITLHYTTSHHITLHYITHMAVDQYSCFRKTPSSGEKSFFRESFATPSPRPFVCSVRSGAIVAAAVMLANTVAAVHRHSPLPLALAGDVRNLATSSLAFRRSFADLSRNLLQNSPANMIDLLPESIMQV